jgi:hypothetical protein
VTGTTYNTHSKLGTYRIGPNLDNLKFPMGSQATMHKSWTDKSFPMSIANYEYAGILSPMELRIEDYYLLKTNALTTEAHRRAFQ